MSQDLRVNHDYAGLLPDLSTQEYESLKRSIKENGQFSPIITNCHKVILDGHHRLRICRELGIEPIISVKNVASPDHEKLFIYECEQRRQLPRYQKIVLELHAQDTRDRIAKAQQNSLANLKHGSEVPTLEHRELQGRIVERVARNTKFAHGTVSKVKKLLDTAPENILRKLSTNKISIDKAFNDVEKEQHQKQIEEEAQTNYYNDKGPKFELFNDDFRNVQLTPNSIDFIFTDPPYPEIWFPNYADLAKLAADTLVPGGSLVTYCNQSQIPEIISFMKEAGLTYWHIISVILDNTYPRHFPRGIVYKYKPLLWFIKGTREENSDHISDVIYSKKPEKHKHPWEQSPIEPAHVIPRLTKANGKSIVLDPMMGSGVTGIVALGLKRRFIGIDKNPMTFQIAKANIGKFVSSGSDLASIIDPIGETERRD